MHTCLYDILSKYAKEGFKVNEDKNKVMVLEWIEGSLCESSVDRRQILRT